MIFTTPAMGGIENFLRDQTNAELVRLDLTPSSIAGQWNMDVDFSGGPWSGSHCLTLVMPGDASRSPAREFAIRKVAFAAGVTTPEPLWLDQEGRALGAPGYVIRAIPDQADQESRRRRLGEDAGEAIAFRVGQELAKLHSVSAKAAPKELGFLALPGSGWVVDRATAMRDRLDSCGVVEPVFEWAISWMIEHAPRTDRVVLSHGDLRPANLLIGDDALAGIEGLGNARWSDPMEDIGCFCARFWRAGVPGREAGGIGSRQAFYDGYCQSQDGSTMLDASRVAFWEIHATLRAGIDAVAGAEARADNESAWPPVELRRMRAIEAQYDLLMDIASFAREAP